MPPLVTLIGRGRGETTIQADDDGYNGMYRTMLRISCVPVGMEDELKAFDCLANGDAELVTEDQPSKGLVGTMPPVASARRSTSIDTKTLPKSVARVGSRVHQRRLSIFFRRQNVDPTAAKAADYPPVNVMICIKRGRHC